jgi:hypothetical protein
VNIDFIDDVASSGAHGSKRCVPWRGGGCPQSQSVGDHHPLGVVASNPILVIFYDPPTLESD